MRYFRALCDMLRKRRRTAVCEALHHCRLLTFVRRSDEVLPCDNADVNFLHCPVESYCAEMYDQLPIVTHHYIQIYAVVAYEHYPTLWKFVVLARFRVNGWRYIACDEEEFEQIRPIVLQIHRDFVRRLNKEFVIDIPLFFKSMLVPTMISREFRRWFGCEELITPYTDENEPDSRLQQYVHRFAPWVRGVWLPVERYGCDRKGRWQANWDWRVADDERIFMSGQRKPLPASYRQRSNGKDIEA